MIAVILAKLAALVVGLVPATQPAQPDCTGDVWLDHLDAPVECDLNPPQTLNARIDDHPDAWLTCEDYGGTPTRDPSTDEFWCVDMDY